MGEGNLQGKQIILKLCCLRNKHPPYPHPKSISGHARITISKTHQTNRIILIALLKCLRVWLKHKPHYTLESQSPRPSFPGNMKVIESMSISTQSMSLALICLGLLIAPRLLVNDLLSGGIHGIVIYVSEDSK